MVQNRNWSGTTGKSKGVMVTRPFITSMVHVSYSVAAICDCPAGLVEKVKGWVSIKAATMYL